MASARGKNSGRAPYIVFILASILVTVLIVVVSDYVEDKRAEERREDRKLRAERDAAVAAIAEMLEADTTTPDDAIAEGAEPAPHDPYAGLPRKEDSDPSLNKSQGELTSSEIAELATEQGLLLHQWERGYTEQNNRTMLSYGSDDVSEYTDNKWLSWPVPTVGMAILAVNPKTNKSRKCTVGGFTGNSTGVFALTAGHCVRGGFNEIYYKRADESGLRPFGVMEQWQVMTKPAPDEIYQFGTDVATIRVNDEVADSLDARVATELTSLEILDPRNITPGMKVCKMGYRTQESCGVVISSNDSEVRTHLFSRSGDSGSVLYTYTNEAAREVAVIGLLSSSPTRNGQTHDFITDFALLAPIVDADNMTYFGK